MPGWDLIVRFFAALLISLAQVYGGNLGLAIITISVLTRLALFPLTLRVARQAQAQQRILLRLRQQIAAIRRRYKSDPSEMSAKLSELYRREGISPLDGRSLGVTALQTLIGAGLYSAIRRGLAQGHRFLWIGDLARPDGMLVLATSAITLIGSIVALHLREQSRVAAVLPAILTAVLAWRLSSAVVLYWASSSAMNAVQALALRRK